MPHQLISLLRENDAVHQFFLVRQAESRTDKSGNPYLSLVLGDKSGAMVARVWNKVLAKCPGPFAPGDAVGVQAQVESYKGELQLNVRYINTVEGLRDLGRDLQDYDPELLCQATPFDRQALWQELRQLAETQIQPPLGQLVLNLLDRYREEFLVCPAARLYHHPYLGGLLEHTWFVTRHALASLTIYPDLNRDLVLAGAILHDLGKVKELVNPPAPERHRAGPAPGPHRPGLGYGPRRSPGPGLLRPHLAGAIGAHYLVSPRVHGIRLPCRAQDPRGPAGKFSG